MVAALAVAAAPAAAEVAERAPTDDAPASARRLAADAKARFDAGDYSGAIAGYGEAYRRHPSPGLLFNLAQAYRLRGDCSHASLMYHQYLREVPASPYRDVALGHIDALAPCTYERTLAGRPEAAPGSPGRGRRIAGITLTVAGAALIGGGWSLAADGSDGGGRRDREDDDGDRRQLGAGLMGAGVATAITGVTLYVLGRRADRAAERYTVRPAVGGGAGVGAVFTASW